MKHMAFGKLALIGAFALAGCYSYATAALDNSDYNKVEATPVFAVITQGDSDQMFVRLINADDNGAVTSYTLGTVPSGIAVDYQSAYRPYQSATLDTLVNTTDKVQQEYYIVGKTPGVYTFTLTPTSVNTGVSTTVTVVVTPGNLGTALSKHTVNPGDTVTVTAPPGTVFNSNSVVSVPGGTVTVASRAADSSSITFVVTSNGGTPVSGPVTVTNVGVPASPATQLSTVLTSDTLSIAALSVTMNKTTANAGDLVTLTVPNYETFTDSSAVSFTPGQTPPLVVTNTPHQLTIAVAPGDTGKATVSNVMITGAPALGDYSVVTTTTIQVPAILVATTTVSNATPGIGVPVTLTLGNSLRFTDSSHIFVGGVEAGVNSISADSSTAVIVPFAPSSGAVTYTNIVLSSLTSIPLSLPAGQSITVGNTGPADPNATNPATAPTIMLLGHHPLVVGDGGPLVPCTAGIIADPAIGAGSLCKYYKITIGDGTLTADIHWGDPAPDDDLALFLSLPDGSACYALLSDTQGTTSGNTGDTTSPANCLESAAFTPAAGTYLVTIVQFGYTGTPSPAWQIFRISQP